MKSHGFETEIEVAAAIDAGHLSLSLEPEIVLATRRCESVRVRPWLTLPGIGPIDARAEDRCGAGLRLSFAQPLDRQIVEHFAATA